MNNMLCNRIAFAGSPSTCALDVGLVPLPSILLLVFYPIFVLVLLRAGSRSIPPTKHEEVSLAKSIHYLYIGFVVCLFAMRILEIARLVAAFQGVGLLPFGLVANVLVLAMLCYNKSDFGLGKARCRAVSYALGLYWLVDALIAALKVARLATLENIYPGKGTAYPTSDWLLDNATMSGLYIVFLIFESAHLYRLSRVSNAASAYKRSRFHATELMIGKPFALEPIVTV